MLKAILFDFDHTLYDREATMKKTLPETYENMKDLLCGGLKYEDFEREMLDTEREFQYDLSISETSRQRWSRRVEYLVKKGVLKAPIDPNSCRIFIGRPMERRIVNYSFVFDLLAQLGKKYKLGILTNGDSGMQWRKIETSGIKEYFDFICVSGDIGIQKPEPEPFYAACRGLGVQPCECVYVGDNPKNDILGAKNAGMCSVWVSTCGPWRYPAYERADFEVENISHLPEILPQIEKMLAK